jgi:hypothetical protein
MKLEDLNVGAIIMRADRKDNLAHMGEMWLVTQFDSVKAKFEAVCLHSMNSKRIGETGIILFDELPDYDLITSLYLQSLNDNLFLRHKPAEPKKDLYLRWAHGEKTSLGKVGVKTPYKLENGRNLFVGDVVSIKNDYMEEKDCLVVHDEDDGYYVMGIASDCNSKTGEIKHFTVSLEKSFSGIKNGDTFATTLHRNGIEVVDFNPEE